MTISAQSISSYTHAPGLGGCGVKSHIARNSAFNFFGQVLPLLVGVLTIPIIIRRLGTDAFGILSIAATLLGCFSMFDLGLGRATTKYVAEYLNPDKVAHLPGLIYTSISIQLLLGIVAALGTLAFVPTLVTRVFVIPPALVHEASVSVVVLVASAPILLASNAVRGVLEAAQRFDLVNYVKVPTSISFYALAALAIPLHWRISTIIWASVLARALAAAAFAILCVHIFPQLKIFTLSRSELHHLLSFGGWVMVSSLAGQMFAYLERFMIASILSVGLLTYYAAPFELISKILIFPASAATALFPFASQHGGMQPHLIAEISNRLLKYILFIMAPILAIFVAFGGTILQFWLGYDFALKSTSVLQLLAFAFFLNALAFIPFTSVQALGRPDLKAALDIVALPVFALYAWILMSHFGITGAAFAKLVSSAIDCTFLFIFARKVNAFHFRTLISGTLARSLLLGGGLTAVFCSIGMLHMPLAWSVFVAAICLAAYALGFWTLGADAEDKIAARRMCRGFLGAKSISAAAD